MSFFRFVFFFAFLVISFSGQPASADDFLWGNEDKDNDIFSLPVTLKKSGEVMEKITLGDIFSGLEKETADKKIANAPACGQEVVLQASWLNNVAKKSGLNWHSDGDEKLILTRACKEFTHKDILKAFQKALREQHLPENAEITLNQQNLHLKAPKEVRSDILIKDAVYQPANASVSGTVVLMENDVETDKKALSGKIVLFFEVPVATRPLGKGEIITENDILVQKMKNDEIALTKRITPTDLIGKEVRRAIRAGDIIDSSLVRNQVIVEKGQTVDMHYVKGGLSLKTQGKSLDSGALNDTVRIQNLQSKTILEGVVIDKNTVSVINGNKGERQ